MSDLYRSRRFAYNLSKLKSVSLFRAAGLFLALPALRSSAGPTLRDTADQANILIGTAVRPGLLSETAYAATLAREFNLVEPEDAMKWPALRPSFRKFDFSRGDEIVAFAQAHNMKIRGHCLVWDHDHPGWLEHGAFTSQQLNRLLHDHIRTVMRHYSGKVFAWDVVNEAFDEHGQLRNSLWFNQPGIGLAGKRTAYIEEAFRWAHQADPRALLFYNDNGGEGMGAKSDAIYAMVKDFKQRGVPIDGVGLQMHISRLDFDPEPVRANIKRLVALGVQVHLTELDVSLPVDGNGKATKEDLDRQADIYRSVARACIEQAGCTGIQTWGFTDKYSWIGSHSHGTRGAALMFDRSYAPKPAFSSVVEELVKQSGRGDAPRR